MSRMAVLALLTVGLFAQAPTVAPSTQALNARQAQELMSRSIQLMDSAGVALPELAHAGAPLIENARQSLANARSSAANLEFYNVFQANVRAFIFVADSLPKPPSF